MSAYEASLLTLVAINVMLALSLNLITGLCGQVSLGHAAFFCVGAYSTALLAKASYGLWLTAPVSVVVAGVVGIVIGLCSLRVRDDFLAIATMESCAPTRRWAASSASRRSPRPGPIPGSPTISGW